MSALPADVRPQELLRRDDDNGVVTLTLSTPQNRNALSLAMIDTLIVALDDIARTTRRASSSSPARGRRLAAATTSRRCRRIATIPIEAATTTCESVRPLRDAHASDRRAAEAGDRGGRGHRDRGRLPARRRLRSRDRRRACALWAFGRQLRALLFDAAGRGGPRDVAQARDGDGADRRPLHRRGGRTLRPRQPRRSGGPRARRRRCALARTIASHSAPTLAIGKRAFYDQIERPLDEAYALASVAMIDNLAEPDCGRRPRRLPRQAAAASGSA